MSLFPTIIQCFCTIILPFFSYYYNSMENTSYVSPFRMAFFYLVITGCAVLCCAVQYGEFLHWLVRLREKSINQSIKEEK